MSEMLNEGQARDLVETYMKSEAPGTPTQEILDSCAVPRLKEYRVQPGKVSDSIFGGLSGQYENADGMVPFENPPLENLDGAPARVMVRTERISTHDLLRGSIPFKDQILASNHNFMRRLLTYALGTSQYDVSGLEDNAVVILAENLQSIPVEMVLRAYMAKSSTSTSLYQHYMNGERVFCGHPLPDDLVPNGPLPYVMDTPSTKSASHDMSVSPEQLFELGLCTPEQYVQIRNSGLFAFGVVSEFLRNRGLIAVDTKTEHGVNRKGQIVSQDEIWTMDSSRFWQLFDYNNQLTAFFKGEINEINPKSFSKEFARGFSKGDAGYTDDQRIAIAVRYIMGSQHLLGVPFQPDLRPRDERVIDGLEKVVLQLAA